MEDKMTTVGTILQHFTDLGILCETRGVRCSWRTKVDHLCPLVAFFGIGNQWLTNPNLTYVDLLRIQEWADYGRWPTK